jgi:uncharacterized protein YxeA
MVNVVFLFCLVFVVHLLLRRLYLTLQIKEKDVSTWQYIKLREMN